MRLDACPVSWRRGYTLFVSFSAEFFIYLIVYTSPIYDAKAPILWTSVIQANCGKSARVVTPLPQLQRFPSGDEDGGHIRLDRPMSCHKL